MQLIRCPLCRTRVAMTTEKTCPSCRMSIADVRSESQADEQSADSPIFQAEIVNEFSNRPWRWSLTRRDANQTVLVFRERFVLTTAHEDLSVAFSEVASISGLRTNSVNHGFFIFYVVPIPLLTTLHAKFSIKLNSGRMLRFRCGDFRRPKYTVSLVQFFDALENAYLDWRDQ